MTYHWTIPLIAALASLALSLLVRRAGPRTDLNRIFTFLSLALVGWNLNFVILYSVSDPSLAFELTRLSRAVSVFLPPLTLHLAAALARRRSAWLTATIRLDYALSLGLFVANAFDLLIKELHTSPWGFYSVGTRLYDLFSLLVILNFVGSALLMIWAFRKESDPRMRSQMKFWLLGSAVALPLGLTNLLPAYGVPIYPLGNLGSAVWAAIVGYAIARHRLMDIDLVLTKGVSYAIVSMVLIVPAFAAALWFQQLSFGQIHTDFSFAILIMLMAVGVLFPTLRLRTQSRLERSFFPEKQEHRGALMSFTRSIGRILERERLIASLAETLSSAFQVDRLAIALRGEGQGSFNVATAVGVPPALEEIDHAHPFVESLARRQDAVLRDELEASRLPAERKGALELCRANGWEVAVPLTAGAKLIGFISLGRKRDLTPFYVEDLDLLGTVAAEAAVALENARLYEELKKSQDIIRRADRLSALGTLAAGIAHEIRNPLVSIQTFFQLAPQRLNDQEFLTEFLNLTSSEVKRITDLITELLSFARSPNPTMVDVDLNGLIDGVARLIEPQLRSGQIRVTRSYAEGLPQTHADRDQLKQVLLNLLLNAIQAMEGGGEIRLATRAVSLQGQQFCQIEIADTGRGIPPEIIDDIFNPFFTTKDKGTGLGLAISNQVVAEHGGFITVESELGKGTTFRIHLRRAESDTASAPVALPHEPEALRATGSRPRYR